MEIIDSTEWDFREAKQDYLRMLEGRLRHWENEIEFWMSELNAHGDDDAGNHLRHAEFENGKAYDLIHEIMNPRTLVLPKMLIK